MQKYSFMNDYSEGCHPQLLQALIDTNTQQHLPYGEDTMSQQARAAIARHLETADTEIRFVASGTLANATIASSILRPFEAVIAAENAHIAMFETGAVEATGHKVITVPGENGKVTTAAIGTVLDEHTHFPHNVRPRSLYISNATELGTVYSSNELLELSQFCRQHDLLLWIDGARLGAALAADDGLSLRVVSQCADIFWIGGTKAGALAGEAIVIPNHALAEGIDLTIKQRGALLSKGRFLGCQFEALFSDGLFFTTAKRAHDLAQSFASAIKKAGFKLLVECDSNQIFAILPNPLIEQLSEKFSFHVWREHAGDASVVRLVTSWATEAKQIESFTQLLVNYRS